VRAAMRRIVLLLAAVTATTAAAGTAAAAPAPEPYGTNDPGGFRNVLPPGQNGHANAADVLLFNTSGERPPHNDDQLGMYGDLVYASPGLSGGDLPRFFKDATFGVRAEDEERTYSPRDDVTIVRDQFGVPHLYGSRAGVMFGAGYVAAEDRLFFIDVLRHLGRAQLSSFVGGAQGNRALDREQWRITPYTEADLQRQYDLADEVYGADGAQVQRDVDDYIAGINQYIEEARLDPTKMPAEYAAITPNGLPEEEPKPRAWRPTDVIATAGLVGGIFGKGGGGELESAQILQAARRRFGRRRGTRVWRDFRSAEDPEAPVTARGRFPYQTQPRRVLRGSRAIPDRGSVEDEPVVESSTGSGGGGGGGGGGEGCSIPIPLPICPPSFPRASSNALLVSGRESRSGRPLFVAGPQTGYFAPQILMELDMHAPGIDARGAAFPGVNLYVQLGRGRDYVWSATSAGQDNIDTFALDLCNPDGSPPTRDSRHYRYHGQCVAMERLERNNRWSPNGADQTPPGSETLVSWRTNLGIVQATGMLRGRPVAYAKLRSTYKHEADAAFAFSDLMDPGKIQSAQDFQRTVNKINYTFNWLYADEQDIAYFNSGWNPVRPRGIDHNFPVRGGRARFEWRGHDPDLNFARYTPFSRHPRALNQSFLTSWNNKQARAYRAADDNFGYHSLYRSMRLDDRIRRGIRGARQMDLPGLVDAMEDAGTVDLRADKVLPWALRVLARSRDPEVRAAVATLRAWRSDGSHRRDADRNGVYEHSEAIRILDAWWPRWMRAQFQPVLGEDLFNRLQGMIELDNAPNNHGQHLGSAYQSGWYGFAQKDLRNVLGRRVRGRYSREYCGRGSLRRCRRALARSLEEALGVPASELYRDEQCEDAGRPGDQWCFDAVFHRPLGAIDQPPIHWIDRPTFQQAVEVQGNRP
jgi:acyl-homoserine lactone acylase PvdQ